MPPVDRMLLGALDSATGIVLLLVVGGVTCVALLAYMVWVCWQKDRLVWGFVGLFVPLVLPVAAIAMARPDSRWAIERYDSLMMERAQRRYPTANCPFCAESIQPEAVVCRWCGRDLPRGPV